MTIVKITIVAWVAVFVLRFFIRATISRQDLIHATWNDGKLEMTFWRWVFVLLIFVSIGLTVASIIWFLFFSGVI